MKPGLFALILCLAVIALLVTVFKLNANISKISPSSSQAPVSTPTPRPNIFGNEITFNTSDKSLISATVYSPVNFIPPYRSLVLVHQFDSDRSDWSTFVPTLLDNGYRVLVFDLKGMGKSPVATSLEKSSEIYLDSLVNDLQAAVNYLRLLPDTDREHIGVIGSSIGANIAYVYSGSNQNSISGTVVISPSATTGPLQGNNIQNFRPSNIFFVTDQIDSQNAQVFFSRSSNPRSIKIYPESKAHGVELLNNPNVVSDILSWLKTNI